MYKILVSGLINIETTLRVDRFPIEYTPVRYPFFGIHSSISGVGFNVAKALTALGDQINFLSLIGDDIYQTQIRTEMSLCGISSEYVLAIISETAHSIILFEAGGRRQIHVDLKDIQDHHYPPEVFESVLTDTELAVLCNINFSRDFLGRVKSMGIPIASDVHAISSLDDEYNHDFMTAADILFCSDELLPCTPEEWAEGIFARFGVNIFVIGMGSRGAYLAVRDQNIRRGFTAVQTRAIVNTIGAGDALFSCFLHYYLRTKDPIGSIRRAMVFASYKIGENGAAEGFLSEQELETIYARMGTI